MFKTKSAAAGLLCASVCIAAGRGACARPPARPREQARAPCLPPLPTTLLCLPLPISAREEQTIKRRFAAARAGQGEERGWVLPLLPRGGGGGLLLLRGPGQGACRTVCPAAAAPGKRRGGGGGRAQRQERAGAGASPLPGPAPRCPARRAAVRGAEGSAAPPAPLAPSPRQASAAAAAAAILSAAIFCPPQAAAGSAPRCSGGGGGVGSGGVRCSARRPLGQGRREGCGRRSEEGSGLRLGLRGLRAAAPPLPRPPPRIPPRGPPARRCDPRPAPHLRGAGPEPGWRPEDWADSARRSRGLAFGSAACTNHRLGLGNGRRRESARGLLPGLARSLLPLAHARGPPPPPAAVARARPPQRASASRSSFPSRERAPPTTPASPPRSRPPRSMRGNGR